MSLRAPASARGFAGSLRYGVSYVDSDVSIAHSFVCPQYRNLQQIATLFYSVFDYVEQDGENFDILELHVLGGAFALQF